MTNKLHVNTLFSLVVFTAALSLTACGGGSKKTASIPVQKRMTNLGEVYTDKEGMTLYTFNKDVPNISNCNDACAVKWPPLKVADNASAQDRFTIITRADNSKQWALDGRPLYRWFKDNAPGDTTGEEVKSLWYVAQTVPVSKRNTNVTSNGMTHKVTVLTDTAGKTLYAFTNDQNKSDGSSCNDGCAVKWPPLIAGDTDQDSGDYSVIIRDDNSKQWAYRGMPLYRFIGDNAPGDTTGEEVGNIWYVAQPIPVSKYHTEAQGTILTDTHWSSLYVLDNETTSNLLCKGGCLTAWPPLKADAGDINRGDYTIFTNSNGDAQWAYKNRPLYRWKNDSAPGQINGHGLGHPSGATWIVAKP